LEEEKQGRVPRQMEMVQKAHEEEKTLETPPERNIVLII